MSSRRVTLAIFLLLDALLLGLLYGLGTLNLLDAILLGSIPNDMIWLLQVVQSLSCGFAIVKILLDTKPGDTPAVNLLRSAAIISSPALLFALVLFTIEMLLKGQGETASITFDLTNLGTSTLMWAATYLSIAIGLTLTYKVQRYGNFAQSELFMVGMYFGMILGWSEYYFVLKEAPMDGVIAWTLLLRSLLLAFVMTGLLGVLIDRIVYRGFRLRDSSPQVMMIASLGVALILRSIYFMRFSSAKVRFIPDSDFTATANRWELPTSRIKLNLGERSLAEGGTYTYQTCEQTGIDETSGEPIMERIVSEGNRPTVEIYDIGIDCISPLTSNLSYANGSLPVVVFISVAMLVLLLNKTRLGMRMRAVADNPELAASSGINVERVQQTSAFLSAGITGVGGAIFSVTLLFNPTTGFALLLPAFAVIVLGTIGSVSGAIIASLMVGFVRASSTPILTGVGFPLDRSGYSALSGVMPYIFLVAILIVLPKGLGDAIERWNIEKERNRNKEARSLIDKRIVAALALLPTGILGLHHWARGRSDKAQNFSIIAFGSYVAHKVMRFIGKNSFADGACSDSCIEAEGRSSNIELITSNPDASLSTKDSPYFDVDASDLDQKWFELMELEIQTVNALSDISDWLWPWVPLALWLFAIRQGLQILRNGRTNENEDRADFISAQLLRVRNSINSSLKGPFSKASTSISEANKAHSALITKVEVGVSGLLLKWRSMIAHKSQKAISLFSDERLDRIRDPYGREGRKGSWIAFAALATIILYLIWWLPVNSSPEEFWWDKIFQVSNVTIGMCVFILMAFSLNLHTGYTGMVNFGIIFFVGVGAITVSVLSSPERYHGYGWGVVPATIFAVLLTAVIGWALAFPTARLRTDYFAIVTISLGEVVRMLLSAEPLLRTGPIKSAIGIGSYPLPLKEWWFCGRGVKTGLEQEFLSPDYCKWASPALDSPANSISDLLSLGEPAPYSLLLATMSVFFVITIWWILERVLTSPWGRIVKAIREDEEVAQHHGHDVLKHKAASLALGAGICGLAGAIWAWQLTGLSPTFMSPAGSTFLVWAAFIIGGSANNRGMVIGASIIVLTGFVFNVLAVASTPDLPLYETANTIDKTFKWIVTDQWEITGIFLIVMFGGIITRRSRLVEYGFWGSIVFCFTAIFMEGYRSLMAASDYTGEVTISGGGMSYVRLMLVGTLMLVSLILNPKGLLPEVPSRPERPSEDTV